MNERYKPEEYKLGLWKDFMDNTELIPEKYKETMGKIAATYVSDTSFLFRIYKGFRENERFIEDEKTGIRYERDRDEHILFADGKECVYDKSTFHRIIASYLDLLEDTLPLGTVVDLKKDAFRNVVETDEVKDFRFVITHRFLGKEEDHFYFPYAGVVYPIGILDDETIYHFTRPMVEKIVHMGYKDESEEAFVYLMKQDLIIKKSKNTYGYATDDGVKEFMEKVREKNGGISL